jgi:outer membrane protein
MLSLKNRARLNKERTQTDRETVSNMKFSKIICLLFLCTVITVSSRAQQAPLLTLKDAVEIALKNNYNIKLAQNNKSIAAKNNVTPGNAGILPAS